MSKFIPEQAAVKAGLWTWFWRLMLAVVLLVFGYAVAYVMNHWQPENLTAYVVAPKPAVKQEAAIPMVLPNTPKPIIMPMQAEQPRLNDLATRIQALESLQGTVGDLSQVFLGQQLVILDGAYRSGGDVLPGVMHVKNFALSVAKNESVAAALEELQAVTPLSGPVTAAELVLMAESLYDMEPLLLTLNPQQNWWQQVVASLKRWIKVTDLDNPQDAGLTWDLGINHVRYSIAHGDAQGALNILAMPPFSAVDTLDLFRDATAQHLLQQQALHRVQRAFIESYQP